MSKFIDLTGQKFGHLTVTGYKRKIDSAGASRIYWTYKCDCGNTGKAMTGNMKRINQCKSCGIKSRADKRSTHRRKPQRLYNIWNLMKRRCGNLSEPNFKDYGGRGISVCEDWQASFEKFRDWALSNGYEDSLSIDRIDVNGNYEPGNCRWTNRLIQNNNTRANHYVEYNGIIKTVAEWSKETGIDKNTIYARLNKYSWPIAEALGFEQRGGVI